MAFCSGSNIWDNRMNCLFGFFGGGSTVINFDVNKEVKVFPRKVIVLVCRRNVSSAPRWTHYRFVFLLFVLTMKCILCRYGNFPYEKYMRLEDEQLWFFKINACELYQTCQMFLMVVYFSYRPWYVLLSMARMTGAGWCYHSGTLSTLLDNAP